ncbi:MAG: type II toxin-antitoxin system VapC family toxin [Vulcanimicrobiota bacterium]
MYLFDTDILSNIIRKKPDPSLICKIIDTPGEYQHTTTINVGELVYGAFKSDRPEYFMEKLINIILPQVIVLSFDEESAFVYGRVRALLEKSGISLSEPDLRIASICIKNKLILVTGNTSHFSRIAGLTVENWLAINQ